MVDKLKGSEILRMAADAFETALTSYTHEEKPGVTTVIGELRQMASFSELLGD